MKALNSARLTGQALMSISHSLQGGEGEILEATGNVEVARQCVPTAADVSQVLEYPGPEGAERLIYVLEATVLRGDEVLVSARHAME